MQLAAAHGRQQAVLTIEHRLGSAADNPMLFLMALSLSGDGVPAAGPRCTSSSSAGSWRAPGRPMMMLGLAALGVAWAEMIGRGQRAADHYSWRLALGTALDDLAALPAWRGHTSTAETGPGDRAAHRTADPARPRQRARAIARLVR